MHSYDRLRKYLERLRSFYPKATLGTPKKNCRDLRFGGHPGRVPTMVAAMPIWANGAFKPARVRLIRGKTELLSGMSIIRKIDITVRFGIDQFKVGQSEWGMVTFNGKRHLVFPLDPTSCAYSKLNEYFGKLRNSKIEVLQLQGDFGCNLSVREVLRAGKQRLNSKIGSADTAISETKDMIRNTLLRVVNTTSGCYGDANDLVGLRRLWNFTI